MPQLIYILFLLIIMNYYLRLRKAVQLKAGEKFMISLMSIFVLFVLYYAVAYFWGAKLDQVMGPAFNIIFTVAMVLVLPVITTELMLWLYTAFIQKNKN